jgi:hypothetical protein
VYETARLGIYVMSVDRDDNMVPCPFQAGAASIDLGSYFAGKISGAASGMESSIFSQGDIAPIGGVAIERLEITSSNDTSFADINL